MMRIARREPYRIELKYLDTSNSKIWTKTIYYPMLCLHIAGWVANSVDPDNPRRLISI